ncbi:hypothetical protein GIB67_023551 [Kingdonia uniflora]|uniref:Alanyl-transfer RNA synthetases family profile domain-containing protein n=1 Tax=Kingdonia uniflora TaxID=39325 RepID=A0A7J7PA98_9MAGN|nr:hypothetical protein GIB67_023551 [Kingdonia uniflora]
MTHFDVEKCVLENGVKPKAIVEIKDVEKSLGNIFVHKGTIREGVLEVGAVVVEAEVDAKLRQHAKVHRATTHLLQATLKSIIAKETSQAVSLVVFEHLRFDFNFHKPLKDNEIVEIEGMINKWIGHTTDLQTKVMPLTDAKRVRATAMFAEKYSECVVEVPSVSMELGGRTHVKAEDVTDRPDNLLEELRMMRNEMYKASAMSSKAFSIGTNDKFNSITPFNIQLLYRQQAKNGQLGWKQISLGKQYHFSFLGSCFLTFKEGLTDPSHRLSSWVDDNCCTLEGVGCDNITGWVVNLNLRNPYDEYSGRNWEAQLRGKINPSLLDLKHLKSLDLSLNNFNGTSIPEFIGSLQNLQYLNLSRAFFSGKLPRQLGNLSKLRHLDLSENRFYKDLDHLVSLDEVDNLQWLSNLSHLEHLNLSKVNLSKASNWLQAINRLPSLLELHLSDCELSHFPSLPYLNFTSLVVLDISMNNFNSSLPNWLYTFHRLKDLNLAYCKFHGTISSSIGNLTSLTRLNMEYNDLEGEIPKTLGNLCLLEVIGLQMNKFGGDVTEILASLFHCLPARLESIQLNGNQLSGLLPHQLAYLTNLKYLDLSDNAFSGPIPDSLGRLSKLEVLRIFRNSFEGVVTETHLANLTSLGVLEANSNSLALNVSPTGFPSFN